MADMIPNAVSGGSSMMTVASGKRIVIKILNADGSVLQTICDDAVPADKTFNGSVSYAGTIA